MHASQPRHGQAKADSMDAWLQTNKRQMYNSDTVW